MLTTIQDSLTYQDGSLVNGRVVVSSPPFQVQGVSVAGTMQAFDIVNGNLTIVLYSNANAQPTGAYYTAKYELENGAVYEEYWIVPNIPLANLGQCRVFFPPTPSVFISAQQLTSSGAQPGMVLTWNGSHWVPGYMNMTNITPNTIGVTLSATVDAADLSVIGSPAVLGGTLTIDVPDAGWISRGVVTTGQQQFSGPKTFLDGVIIYLNSGLSSGSDGVIPLNVSGGAAGPDLGDRAYGASFAVAASEEFGTQGVDLNIFAYRFFGFDDVLPPDASSLEFRIQHSVVDAIGTTLTDMAWLGLSTDLTFGTSLLERMRITAAGLVGVGTSTPSWNLDVVGDVNCSGVFRIGGVPIGTGGTGAVASVFGRTGVVVAVAGDYAAAQVTNAVSTIGSYADPAWITSLAWSKITGAPTGGGVSSVFTRTGAVVAAAGDYTAAQVTNAVSTIGSYADPAWITSLAWAKIAGAPAFVLASRQVLAGAGMSGGGALSADVTLTAKVFIASGSSHAIGAVPDPGATVGATRYLREDATWAIPSGTGGGLTDPTTTLGDILVRGASAVTRLGVGANGQVLTADSTQTLGVKWAAPTGGAQTPWLTDIIGGGFALSNVRYIAIGSGAPQAAPSVGLSIQGNQGVTSVYVLESSTTGYSALILNASVAQAVLALNGGATSTDPNYLRLTNNTAGIIFSTSGAERARLSTAGNFGIGTVTPTRLLEVFGPVTGVPVARFGNANQSVDVGGYESVSNSAILNCSGGGLALQTQGTNRLVIAYAGNVGVGVSVAAYKVDVAGDCNITGAYRVNGAPLALGQPQTPWAQNIVGGGFSLTNVSQIGLNTTAPVRELHVASVATGGGAAITGGAPSFMLSNADTEPNTNTMAFAMALATANGHYGLPNPGDSMIFNQGSAHGDLYINSNYAAGGGSPRNVILQPSTGNVGIGTKTPGAKLSIDLGSITGTVSSVLINAVYNTSVSGLGVDWSVNGSGFTEMRVLGALNAAGTMGELAFYTNANVVNANGTEKVRITGGGAVGIGILAPTFQLQLSTDSAGKPSTSTWSVVSDLRLKQNIQPVKDDSLAILNKLDWIRYEYNGQANMPQGTKGIGLIAQELLLQLPEAVRSNKTKLNETDAEETDVMAIDYHYIIVHSARAIQQLNAEVQALRAALIGKP